MRGNVCAPLAAAAEPLAYCRVADVNTSSARDSSQMLPSFASYVTSLSNAYQAPSASFTSARPMYARIHQVAGVNERSLYRDSSSHLTAVDSTIQLSLAAVAVTPSLTSLATPGTERVIRSIRACRARSFSTRSHAVTANAVSLHGGDSPGRHDARAFNVAHSGARVVEAQTAPASLQRDRSVHDEPAVGGVSRQQSDSTCHIYYAVTFVASAPAHRRCDDRIRTHGRDPRAQSAWRGALRPPLERRAAGLPVASHATSVRLTAGAASLLTVLVARKLTCCQLATRDATSLLSSSGGVVCSPGNPAMASAQQGLWGALRAAAQESMWARNFSSVAAGGWTAGEGGLSASGGGFGDAFGTVAYAGSTHTPRLQRCVPPVSN
eukprot:1195441-Prorocentrum_minimum.AAC.18